MPRRPRTATGPWRMGGRKPKLSPEQVAEAAAALAIRKSMPTARDWARKLGVSKETLRRAIREGYKNHRVNHARMA